MSITHSLLKLPDKQNYVTQNAENCTVLLHFVPYGTKISAHTETSISVVNGHFDTAENLTFFTAFTTANLKNGTGRKFYILYAKFAMSITHLLLKLPDKQNLCNAKRRKLHGFASFCAIRYKKFRTQSNLPSCKQFF